MSEQKTDCCFRNGKDWFRYRVGAVIVCDGQALFAYDEKNGHYYSVGGGVHMGERSDEAVIREVFEETGEHFQIVRPLCLIENFFKGTGVLGELNCHTIEYYYLMKPVEGSIKRYNAGSVNMDGHIEKMCWLPIDRLDEYDIRPMTVKKLVQDPPQDFKAYVNDELNREDTI